MSREGLPNSRYYFVLRVSRPSRKPENINNNSLRLVAECPDLSATLQTISLCCCTINFAFPNLLSRGHDTSYTRDKNLLSYRKRRMSTVKTSSTSHYVASPNRKRYRYPRNSPVKILPYFRLSTCTRRITRVDFHESSLSPTDRDASLRIILFKYFASASDTLGEEIS